MESLFEGFAGVCFIVGERRNWIPHSSRSGPFVSLFKEIIKDSYRLGKNERSMMLRNIYFNSRRSGQPSELVRISAKDPCIPNASSSRLKVYRYRRLPSLTKKMSEMKPLVQWLKHVEGVCALVGTWQDANEACVRAIQSYKYVSEHEVGYDGFPLSVSEIQSPPTSSTPRDIEQGRRAEICAEFGLQVGVNGRGNRSDDSSTRMQGSSNTGSNSTVVDTTNSDGNGSETPPSQDCSAGASNERMLDYVLHYLDLVHCDDLLMALCMVFDSRLKSMFHIVVGAFRQKCKGKQPQVPYLVGLLLDYCHDKAFGVKDQNKHREMETCLRSTMENFTLVRALYGLKAYEEMGWNFSVPR